MSSSTLAVLVILALVAIYATVQWLYRFRGRNLVLFTTGMLMLGVIVGQMLRSAAGSSRPPAPTGDHIPFMVAVLGGMFGGLILGLLMAYFAVTRPRRKQFEAYRSESIERKIEGLKRIYGIERADPHAFSQIPLYVIAFLGVAGLFVMQDLDPSGYYAALYAFVFFAVFIFVSIYVITLRTAIARLIALESRAAEPPQNRPQ